MAFEVWAEKYRPKLLKEVINQNHVVKHLKAFVKDKNIPNLLFAGRAGTGKTTCALCISRELYGKGWKGSVLELNASDERGIDVIRHKVKDFARMQSIGGVPFKIIILDEADALTRDAQQALRRTMENYTKTCRFILICNYSSKIIDPIQSRCSLFRFKSLLENDIKEYIGNILKGEALKITADATDAVIDISMGDLRKVSNIIQASAIVTKNITEKIIFDVTSRAKPDDVERMLKFALSGDFKKARKSLHELILKQGLAGEDIIKEIHKQVYSLDITEGDKIKLVDKIGEYDFRISEGGSAMIQLEALLAQFMLLKSK